MAAAFAKPSRERSVRSDLALEAHERLRGEEEVPGVRVNERRTEHCLITRVEITSPEAERAMGKAAGHYITVEAPELRHRNREVQAEVARVFAGELGGILPPDPRGSVLVVGLGNWNATPDALGPRVVNDLLITRHLKNYVPPDLAGRLRSVCAIAPGVLGSTGIETGEIIRGIVERVQPESVVAVDALAARKLERIVTTVQIADSGIHPGSGVGNHRAGITRDTLGCPVIAIGVPTVVHATTIASDVIELLLDQLRDQAQFYEILEEMDHDDKWRLIDEVLSPSVGDLMVTPKEIDVFIEDMSRVVASGLNQAFHPNIDPNEIDAYMLF